MEMLSFLDLSLVPKQFRWQRKKKALKVFLSLLKRVEVSEYANPSTRVVQPRATRLEGVEVYTVEAEDRSIIEAICGHPFILAWMLPSEGSQCYIPCLMSKVGYEIRSYAPEQIQFETKPVAFPRDWQVFEEVPPEAYFAITLFGSLHDPSIATLGLNICVCMWKQESSIKARDATPKPWGKSDRTMKGLSLHLVERQPQHARYGGSVDTLSYSYLRSIKKCDLWCFLTHGFVWSVLRKGLLGPKRILLIMDF